MSEILEPSVPTTPRKKVLVIDDSATIRKSAEVTLSKHGFQVEVACNGFEAMSAMVRFAPDLVFVDIMMPRLDGYQTCAIIKQNGRFRNTPVIMLSSKDGLLDRARGRLVGADDYMTKPFSSGELLAALRRIFAEGETHHGPAMPESCSV